MYEKVAGLFGVHSESLSDIEFVLYDTVLTLFSLSYCVTDYSYCNILVYSGLAQA